MLADTSSGWCAQCSSGLQAAASGIGNAATDETLAGGVARLTGSSQPGGTTFFFKAAEPPGEKSGDIIGRYQLLKALGEGGMGTVWLADQHEPVKRRVALKVIKLGMDTRQVVARFEAERQALAMMDHAGIAKVFDAGATENGRPYFVMELVEGVPLTEFCDTKRLGLTARLTLFIQVCQALQHAHQKGLIHRDLKPSNILVAQQDGEPVPKVIDFGVAKATGGQLTDATLTLANAFVGTPAYASPEQAGIGVDVDTRSDVYSLGVILYELLTGRLPFDAAEFRQASVEEMLRLIREQDPAKPSARVGSLDDADQATLAEFRHSDTRRLVTALRGDLDWIVMRALEKDRARRYDSANGLAQDIQRHLDNEAVLACPPSTTYVLGKLVRRHRLAFAAGAAVAASLVIGLGVSTWLFFKEKATSAEATLARLKAEASETKATTEASRSKQVAQFMRDILAKADPKRAENKDTALLREILDNTVVRLDKDLAGQPLVRADLLGTIGWVYRNLGDTNQAVAMLRLSTELYEATPGATPADAVTARTLWGVILRDRRELAEAEQVFDLALRTARAQLGPAHPLTGRLMFEVSSLWRLRKQPGKQEEFARQAVEVLRQNPDPGPGAFLSQALRELAEVLVARGQLKEAETIAREAVAESAQRGGYVLPNSQRTLGEVLEAQQRLPEAREIFEQALRMQRTILPENGPNLLHIVTALNRVLTRLGDDEARQAFWRETLELRRTKLGADHPLTVQATEALAVRLKQKPAAK